jgi:serine/threonine protein kinase
MIQFQECFQLKENKETYCIAMQHLKGISLLEKIIHDYQNLKPHTLQVITKSIACQLQVLHDSNYIHYDLKPSNLIFHSQSHINLIDFGLSKRLSNLSPSMDIIFRREGTLQYQPPECFLHHQTLNQFNQTINKITISQKVDIWAFGCILYQMTYGLHPFYEDTSL